MHQYRKINITAEFYSSFPSQPFFTSNLFDYSSSKLRTRKMAACSGSSAYVTMFPAR